MNDFRSKILSGKARDTGLLSTKRPSNRKVGGEDSLERVSVPRSETRTANHRDVDRHRLSEEQPVTARHGTDTHEVKLINLSGGGAMIEAGFRPELWDTVELDLGCGESSGQLECAVRWIKGDRIGLEFAHETRIDADEATRCELLRDVLERSFPKVRNETAADTGAEAAVQDDSGEDEAVLEKHSRRTDHRHPLIWTGEVHFDHDTTPVRLRNISSSGALVEGGPAFPVGAELLLDLDEAGQHFAVVSWVRGDQAGIAFRSAFDIAALAKAKPQLAPGRWTKPQYLRDESTDSSPWASEWGRLSVNELRKTLGR